MFEMFLVCFTSWIWSNRKIILNLVVYANGILSFLPAILGVYIGSKVLSLLFF